MAQFKENTFNEMRLYYTEHCWSDIVDSNRASDVTVRYKQLIQYLSSLVS